MTTELQAIKERAEREGWLWAIRTKDDETALLKGYYYDPQEAARVVDFIETVIYTLDDKGQSVPVKLLNWQREIVSLLFGWKKPNGRRRFRECSVWLPKKNGKSWLCSVIILTLLMIGGEPLAEIYSCATSERQAKIVFNAAANLVALSPILSECLEVIPSTNRIIFPQLRAFYEVLSSSVKSSEGYPASAVVIDELHRHTNDELFKSLRYAGRSRKQPLFLTISTAGVYDPLSIGWRVFEKARKVEAGIASDLNLLPIVYAADPDKDEIDDAQVWLKCNPSMREGLIDLDDFRADFEAVKHSPSDLPSWLRYSLNLWVQASTTWIPDDKYQACLSNETLTDEQLKSIEWYGGLDLSSTIDISSLVLFGRLDGHAYVIPFFWINESQAKMRQSRDNVSYLAWINEKAIRVTEGDVVDYETIRRDINEIRETYNLKAITCDRWNATHIATQLMSDGIEVTFTPQTMQNLNAPTKAIERLVYDKSLRHDGNPVLRWMFGNVYLERDSNDNVRPSKKRSKEKIDGVIALAMAVALEEQQHKAASVYERQGLTFI